jgi:hypothetical protein
MHMSLRCRADAQGAGQLSCRPSAAEAGFAVRHLSALCNGGGWGPEGPACVLQQYLWAPGSCAPGVKGDILAPGPQGGRDPLQGTCRPPSHTTWCWAAAALPTGPLALLLMGSKPRWSNSSVHTCPAVCGAPAAAVQGDTLCTFAPVIAPLCLSCA